MTCSPGMDTCTGIECAQLHTSLAVLCEPFMHLGLHQTGTYEHSWQPRAGALPPKALQPSHGSLAQHPARCCWPPSRAVHGAGPPHAAPRETCRARTCWANVSSWLLQAGSARGKGRAVRRSGCVLLGWAGVAATSTPIPPRAHHRLQLRGCSQAYNGRLLQQPPRVHTHASSSRHARTHIMMATMRCGSSRIPAWLKGARWTLKLRGGGRGWAVFASVCAPSGGPSGDATWERSG